MRTFDQETIEIKKLLEDYLNEEIIKSISIRKHILNPKKYTISLTFK